MWWSSNSSTQPELLTRKEEAKIGRRDEEMRGWKGMKGETDWGVEANWRQRTAGWTGAGEERGRCRSGTNKGGGDGRWHGGGRGGEKGSMDLQERKKMQAVRGRRDCSMEKQWRDERQRWRKRSEWRWRQGGRRSDRRRLRWWREGEKHHKNNTIIKLEFMWVHEWSSLRRPLITSSGSTWFTYQFNTFIAFLRTYNIWGKEK